MTTVPSAGSTICAVGGVMSGSLPPKIQFSSAASFCRPSGQNCSCVSKHPAAPWQASSQIPSHVLEKNWSPPPQYAITLLQLKLWSRPHAWPASCEATLAISVPPQPPPANT